MDNSNKYQTVIIGGGPGGYVAAIRASQLGRKVAIVEKETLGGICLNWGCIPTKALLYSADVLHTVKNAKRFGIDVGDYSVDFKSVIKRSRGVSSRLSKGVEYLMKKNEITYISGRGTIKSPTEVEVKAANGETTILRTDDIIIATGARNKIVPGLETDGKRIISYREALVLDEVPSKMIIIGAGAIGVEFAAFYREFGADVHLVEMLPSVLPIEDEEISKALESSLKKRGIKVYTSTKVEKIDILETGVKVHLLSGDETKIIEGDLALTAIGFQGNIENIGLENVGVEIVNGWIKTDQFYETSDKGIFAIGDVIGPPWLAHVASAEGRIAAEYISGKHPQPLDYNNIPGCIYCHPQVASIGLTEKQAREQGYNIKVGRFPFRVIGKALARGDSEGFVKIIFDEKNDELLGCHILGTDATELIMEIAVARTLKTTADEILLTVHAHPTLSEAIMEAAADAYGEAIHI